MEKQPINLANPLPRIKYKLHWHVLIVHFPISFFTVSAGFMVLHMFTDQDCFELSAFLTLLAGAAVMAPTIFTGWKSWKKNYKGAATKIFLYKIRISFIILAISLILVLLRSLLLPGEHSLWHWTYALGFVALFVGSVAEGFYGGRLNHH